MNLTHWLIHCILYQKISTNAGINNIDRTSLTWALYDDIKNKQIKKVTAIRWN